MLLKCLHGLGYNCHALALQPRLVDEICPAICDIHLDCWFITFLCIQVLRETYMVVYCMHMCG
jgi:hypothetical protein